MLRKLDELWQEVRHGRMLLVKNRGFTVIVSLTLALGIGATSAIFSVLYATVLAPLPFPDSERLVWIQEVNNEGRRRTIPLETIDVWRRQSRTMEANVSQFASRFLFDERDNRFEAARQSTKVRLMIRELENVNE